MDLVAAHTEMERTMKKIPAVLLAISISSVANAAEWWVVSVDDKGRSMEFVDIQSLRKESPGKITVWNDNFDGSMNHLTALTSYDCKEHKVAILTVYKFDSSDHIVSSQQQQQRREYLDIPPESIAEHELGIVCSKDPRALLRADIPRPIPNPKEYVSGFWAYLDKKQKEQASQEAPATTPAPAAEPSTPEIIHLEAH